MAKQDKSRFQLNKGTDHGFDISKGGKRKFDLSKDDEEPVVAPAEKPQPATSVNTVKPTSGPEEKTFNKWLWISVAIIVIILLIWWLYPGESSEPIVEEDTIEEVATPAENTEDVPDEAEISAGEDAEEENANNDEGSNPSEPAVNNPETTTAPAVPQTTNNVAQNNAPSVLSNDVEAEALKVIRGEYGIGQERKDMLGNRYEAIQRRVNELKREGAF